jgi:ABC-type antimicrobial peptide transport system permease subunit
VQSDTHSSETSTVGVRHVSAIDDLRHAARSLARTPLYTAVSILTLALGIGATTAVFTVVGSVLLKPLPFAVLSIAVVLVLLLACADVANLALLRATVRMREIAVRSALGARPARIVRALLSESALIAIVGGVLGVMLAVGGVTAFLGAAPASIPRQEEIHIDLRALGAAIAATAVAVVLCALGPAVVTGRRAVVAALKVGGRAAGADRWGLRLHGTIVAGQIALSVVLVTGAGLLINDAASREIMIRTSTAPGPLLVIFSSAALLLAGLGLYGVLAYSAAQRAGEFGIRMALGASAADIVRLVARNAAALIAVGITLGTAGALLLSRTMRSLLYGVTPNDPTTLVTVAALLAVVAALASYLPTRRATRIDPAVALRAE